MQKSMLVRTNSPDVAALSSGAKRATDIGVAIHMPGVANRRADILYRTGLLPREWRVDIVV